MKKSIISIASALYHGVISEVKAAKQLVETLSAMPVYSELLGFEISEPDYGIHKLRRKGEVIFEGSKIDCVIRIMEISRINHHAT